jgi:hypothetical protein
MLAVSPVYTICTETAMKLNVTRSVTLLHKEAIRDCDSLFWMENLGRLTRLRGGERFDECGWLKRRRLVRSGQKAECAVIAS